MKRFRFRLEKVLEHRKRIKEERKKVLLEKNLRVRELEDEIERIDRELAKDHGESGTQAANTKEMQQLVARYRSRLRAELVELELNLIQAKEEQEAALELYKEAAKDEEALVKLRERKESEHLEHFLKEEEKFLDEVNVQRGNPGFGD